MTDFSMTTDVDGVATITWDVNQAPSTDIFANDTSFTASRNGATNTVTARLAL